MVGVMLYTKLYYSLRIILMFIYGGSGPKRKLSSHTFINGSQAWNKNGDIMYTTTSALKPRGFINVVSIDVIVSILSASPFFPI